MKSICIGLFLVSLCAPVWLLLLSFSKKKDKSKPLLTALRWVMLTVFFSIVFNLMTLIVKQTEVGAIFYSLFFVSADWLIYFLWVFVLDYTEIERSKYINLRLLRIMMYVDSLSMLLNQIFHHVFTCRKVVGMWGESYICISARPWYYVHLFLSYMILSFIIITLIYRAHNTPALYRKKYRFLLVTLIVIAFTDVVYVFAAVKVNISIPFFAIGTVLTYYYAIAYLPEDFIRQSLSAIVQGMGETLFLLDAEGRITYANDRGEFYIEKYRTDMRTYIRQLAAWCQVDDFRVQEAFSKEKSWKEDGEQHYYKIIFNRLFDKSGKGLGGCLIIQNRTKEYNEFQKERYLATHDRLTGVYNKEYFYEQAEKCIQSHPDETFLIVCSDIRNFKLINDFYGSEQADILLQRIGTALRKQAMPGEVYGRLVNDRFVLLMRKRDYQEKVFVQRPEQVVRIEGDVIFPVRTYIGVYEVQPQDTSVPVMCDRAILALEMIKEDYNKRVAYYTDELREKIFHEQELSSALEDAIREKQFKVYLQPQITAAGEVLGAEALVRWQHPERGMIPPGEFIEVFEKNGMIVRVDQYMWEEACRQLKKWRDRGWKDLYISVNISPRDFLLTDIYECFTSLIRKYNVPPYLLKLEITETSMMENFEEKLKLIEKLQKAGFTVEMDDFGSGYSSLNMLKNIDVDVLKVDMAFLGQTDDEERGRTILKSVVRMSKELGTTVLIEGVETKEQLEFLKKCECNIFQGYYFAKPMPIAEFEEMYCKQKNE